MGIEPTPTAWKAVVLAVILHPHIEFSISHKILTQRILNVKAYFPKKIREADASRMLFAELYFGICAFERKGFAVKAKIHRVAVL